jgi:hypothetical protein
MQDRQSQEAADARLQFLAGRARFLFGRYTTRETLCCVGLPDVLRARSQDSLTANGPFIEASLSASLHVKKAA